MNLRFLFEAKPSGILVLSGMVLLYIVLSADFTVFYSKTKYCGGK